MKTKIDAKSVLELDGFFSRFSKPNIEKSIREKNNLRKKNLENVFTQ
jgi:hypothetical protein